MRPAPAYEFGKMSNIPLTDENVRIEQAFGDRHNLLFTETLAINSLLQLIHLSINGSGFEKVFLETLKRKCQNTKDSNLYLFEFINEFWNLAKNQTNQFSIQDSDLDFRLNRSEKEDFYFELPTGKIVPKPGGKQQIKFTNQYLPWLYFNELSKQMHVTSSYKPINLTLQPSETYHATQNTDMHDKLFYEYLPYVELPINVFCKHLLNSDLPKRNAQVHSLFPSYIVKKCLNCHKVVEQEPNDINTVRLNVRNNGSSESNGKKSLWTGRSFLSYPLKFQNMAHKPMPPEPNIIDTLYRIPQLTPEELSELKEFLKEKFGIHKSFEEEDIPGVVDDLIESLKKARIEETNEKEVMKVINNVESHLNYLNDKAFYCAKVIEKVSEPENKNESLNNEFKVILKNIIAKMNYDDFLKFEELYSKNDIYKNLKGQLIDYANQLLHQKFFVTQLKKALENQNEELINLLANKAESFAHYSKNKFPWLEFDILDQITTLKINEDQKRLLEKVVSPLVEKMDIVVAQEYMQRTAVSGSNDETKKLIHSIIGKNNEAPEGGNSALYVTSKIDIKWPSILLKLFSQF